MTHGAAISLIKQFYIDRFANIIEQVAGITVNNGSCNHVIELYFSIKCTIMIIQYKRRLRLRVKNQAYYALVVKLLQR